MSNKILQRKFFSICVENNYSTEATLLKVEDDITRALDINHTAFFAMLDLPAAFDPVS